MCMSRTLLSGSMTPRAKAACKATGTIVPSAWFSGPRVQYRSQCYNPWGAFVTNQRPGTAAHIGYLLHHCLPSVGNLDPV